MKELKPCADCGGIPESELIEGRISIWCPECNGLGCTTAVGATMDHAIDMWNESVDWLNEVKDMDE